MNIVISDFLGKKVFNLRKKFYWFINSNTLPCLNVRMEGEIAGVSWWNLSKSIKGVGLFLGQI